MFEFICFHVEFIHFKQYEFTPTYLNSYISEMFEFNMFEFIRFKQYEFVLLHIHIPLPVTHVN